MKLTELRRSKNLAQTDLAKKLKICQSTVSMWERNKSTPTYRTMRKLADALDVDLQTIVACFVQDKTQQKTKKE